MPIEILVISSLRLYVLRIPDLVLNNYSGAHLEELKKKEEVLASNVRLAAALKGNHAGSLVSSTPSSQSQNLGGGAEPSRTVASPDWEGDQPPCFETRVTFESTAIDAFDAGVQSLECYVRHFASTH